MPYILDKVNDRLVEAKIVPVKKKDIPLKKDGWNFNWRQLAKEDNAQTFVLRLADPPNSVEGALHLKIEQDMLIMDVLELAPHNIGRANKHYDYVAGCLIAYACRESVKLEGNYKGFLSFVSKTGLIRWYSEKYGAESELGQRMFIDCVKGKSLIDEYLNRKKTD